MPRAFKDNEGRVWTLAVVYNSVAAVLAATGIDLRHLREDHEGTAAELDDPRQLKAVIGVLTEAERDKRSVSLDDLFNAITSDEQSSAMVMALYQATFDFFQSTGQQMNDALDRVVRAMETAAKHAAQRMRSELSDGTIDAILKIVTDPTEAERWLTAAQDATANPALAAAWSEVQGLSAGKQVGAFARLIVTRRLTLTPSAGDWPASSASTPAPSVGDSST